MTLDGSNDASNVTSSSIGTTEQKKLSPELRKLLDFTTPYKVLVNKKSWDKHKNKVNDVLIEKLPEKQKETSRKVSKFVKIDQFAENSISICRNLKNHLNLKLLNHNYDNDFQVWSLKWKFLKP